jgi:hypothetical protein
MPGTRKINVLRTEQIASGTDKKGREWALYSVIATTPDGAAIEDTLKSFSPLPQGEVEVEVERQDDPKYGVSYMLKRVGGSAGSRLGPKVDELRDRVESLEGQVAALRDSVTGLVDLTAQLARDTPGQRPSPQPRPEPEPEDIPF